MTTNPRVIKNPNGGALINQGSTQDTTSASMAILANESYSNPNIILKTGTTLTNDGTVVTENLTTTGAILDNTGGSVKSTSKSAPINGANVYGEIKTSSITSTGTFSFKNSAGIERGSFTDDGAWSFPANPTYQARSYLPSYSLTTGTALKFNNAFVSGFYAGSGTTVADQYTAPVAGIYLISILVWLSVATTSSGYITLTVNNVDFVRIAQFPSASSTLLGTVSIKVNAGDVIRFINAGVTGATVSANPLDGLFSFIKIA